MNSFGSDMDGLKVKKMTIMELTSTFYELQIMYLYSRIGKLDALQKFNGDYERTESFTECHKVNFFQFILLFRILKLLLF